MHIAVGECIESQRVRGISPRVHFDKLKIPFVPKFKRWAAKIGPETVILTELLFKTDSYYREDVDNGF